MTPSQQRRANAGGLLDVATTAGNAIGNWWDVQHPMDKLALGTAPIPILGDVTGLAADARMFAQEPESRTPLNFGLSALGALPFVPAMSAIVRGYGQHGDDVADALKGYDNSVDARIGANDRSITLSKIIVDEAERGKGIGSDFMGDLTNYADQKQLPIQLSPTSEFGSSPKRLKEFYKKAGFIENKGNNRDFEISETMYRNPEKTSGNLDLANDAPEAIDYRGAHQAPSAIKGTSLDDISAIYPDDVYSSNGLRYYGSGLDGDAESLDIMRKAAGNPDAEITIYRSVPKGVTEINAGDWVGLSEDYVKQHGNAHVDNGAYDILSKKVKASTLNTSGDALTEWGYNPSVDEGLLGMPKAPQDDALKLAQKNAALSIEDGGLGLPENNTAMDRASAMGNNTEAWHYSRGNENITDIRDGNLNLSILDSLGMHSGAIDAATDRASNTRSINPNTGMRDEALGAFYPLKINTERQMLNQTGNPYTESELSAILDLRLRKEFNGEPWENKAKGLLRDAIWGEYDSIPYINEVEGKGSISYITPKGKVRSANAAFDPMRRESANLLAGIGGIGLTGLLGYNMQDEGPQGLY